jgi:hypothetical protein
MDLPTTLLGWILAGLMAVVVSCAALLVRAFIVYASVNIHNALFNQLKSWAATYVKALAQDPTLEGLASDEKKQRAIIWIVNKAEKLGIDLTISEASQLVEEAVWLLKNSSLPAIADALETPVPMPEAAVYPAS